jgi:hypothetical protein
VVADESRLRETQAIGAIEHDFGIKWDHRVENREHQAALHQPLSVERVPRKFGIGMQLQPIACQHAEN